jgi:sulfonate transport system permease protein
VKSARMLWALLSFAVGAGLVGVWQLIADAHLISPVFLPSPYRAFGAMVGGFENGVLWAKVSGTIVRMIYGWLLASLVGIAIGALIGSSTRARRLLEPTLEFLRPLPASAVIPLAIGLFGLTETMVLAVICFGALWPALLATVHGFAAVEPRLYEVARALGMSRFDIIRKIALPSSVPDILSGLRISLTISLILAIVGEMLSSRDGLGSWILLAARSFRSPDLFAGIIVLSAIGYCSSMLLGLLEARMLRWTRR